MVMAFDLSVRLGLCPAEDARRLRRHLEAVGLPVGLARGGNLPEWKVDALLAHMAKDKKVRDGRVAFTLARGIGRAFVPRARGPGGAAHPPPPSRGPPPRD